MKEHDATELAYENGYEKGKTEAVRKMQENLKGCRVIGVYGIHSYLKADIDQLLKEMFTERKEK